MKTLLLLLTLSPALSLAEDRTAIADDDLDDDLDWEDDGTRPDTDAGSPDADPTWDVGEGDLPLDLEADPGLGGPSTAPALDEDPDWDLDSPADVGLGEDAPADVRPASRPARPGAVGRTPLADNYPIEIVGSDLEAIVIELPVLVAQRRAELSGEFWLIGEIYLNGSRVSESRTLVTAAVAAEDTPSFVWIKTQAPVSESSGTVEVRLSRQEVGGASQPLFTRTADYRL